MMPMIATTISSSMSVKPFWLRTFMTVCSSKIRLGRWTDPVGLYWCSPAADAFPESNGNATADLGLRIPDKSLVFSKMAGLSGAQPIPRHLPIFGLVTNSVKRDWQFLSAMRLGRGSSAAGRLQRVR
jgi:hypothetical protein